MDNISFIKYYEKIILVDKVNIYYKKNILCGGKKILQGGAY